MSILNSIVASKKKEIVQMPNIASPKPCNMDFSRLLDRHPILIAEIKEKSPSEGKFVNEFNPTSIANEYLEGGADALSILTDKEFFGGSFDVLRQVRTLTNKPLLCKEFIIDEKQIRFARAHGADLCLLIVKILTPRQLQELKNAIENLGMKAVVEVQNREELQIALAAQPEIILINNRNLNSFSVDMMTTANLLEYIPDPIKIIAASGIQTPEQIKNFPARINGFLIGSALMRSADRRQFLKRCRK